MNKKKESGLLVFMIIGWVLSIGFLSTMGTYYLLIIAGDQVEISQIISILVGCMITMFATFDGCDKIIEYDEEDNDDGDEE